MRAVAVSDHYLPMSALPPEATVALDLPSFPLGQLDGWKLRYYSGPVEHASQFILENPRCRSVLEDDYIRAIHDGQHGEVCCLEWLDGMWRWF